MKRDEDENNMIEFDVVVRLSDLRSAEIVKAEIKHRLGYDAEIITGKLKPEDFIGAN